MLPSYGLRQDALSPREVLAQSVSTIAPSTTPNLTVPLVFALAGNGSWLAYGIAMAAMVLVALPIATFARRSASPGSLYTYTRGTLPPAFGTLAALTLLFAYITTAASVMGGFVNSCQLFLQPAGVHVPGGVLALMAATAAVLLALGDVSLSARVMLWVEFTSVALIAIVVAVVLWQRGMHLDPTQLHLAGASAGGVRLGVMLAIFSFVGFESATTLGAEASEPLRTIPRAVLLSAVTAGLFFIVCTYAETAAFGPTATGLTHAATGLAHAPQTLAQAPTTLGDSTSPMRWLASLAHLPALGPAIDVGVLVSMFAATLACIIAAARVLLAMSHQGLTHHAFRRTHPRHETPVTATLVTALLALAPAAVLSSRGVSGADIYGYMGSLAVFGFLTAYALAAVASIVFLKRRGELTAPGVIIGALAAGMMLAGVVFSLYPVPPAPYRYLPYVYLGCLALGGVMVLAARRQSVST